MDKKLVILGTNEYQNPLIVRAKELGYETHVFGWRTGAIGETTADVYYDLNILDYETLWKEVEKIQPCGVASIASELAMHPMNYLLRKLGIPCNSLKTEKIATNKYLMRCVMRDAGLDGPKFALVGEYFSMEEVSEFKYPLIVKPVDLSSSRGVMKVNSSNELQDAVNYALSWSKKKKVLVEEFIEGPEYSGESIAYEGKYKLLVLTEKQTTGAPHYIERGHRQPAKLSPEIYKRVEETLYKAFASIGIEYGAVHPEFKITNEGKVIFMEVGARMGGDCIGSDLVPISTGYDFMGMVISIGCGKEPSFEKIREPKNAEIRYIIDKKDKEEFEKICKEEPEVLCRFSDMKKLSDKPILKSADRAGYFITAR
ncbi:ATP-grasp domain-containing protein [Clostridium perfringens]|uniref:ATP-grasp domain-containing protein n=1 Tax=Clostridium perfringens TaxID=1502 RepID=UPI0018E456E5|nr:ATP-grasp domain-containing protein [Clostridium perfringens]MBI5995325.1 ATP-grasp domain-containing protein [Clostridium perfringens]MDZ4964575.1 ATP-grasp domain-containing protein [Clostridium perfringens]MDZ5013101.1 ATP-grasp domain-containing protein [Clostridium perfringens]